MIFFASSATPSTPLSVVADPTAFAEERRASTGNVGTALLTITGGVAPYTALWLSDNVDIIVSSPTSTTSSMITFTGLASVLDSVSGTVTITIEDAVGQFADFNVSVFVIRIS